MTDLANPPAPSKNAQSGLHKSARLDRPQMGSRKSTANSTMANGKSKQQTEFDRKAWDLYADWVIPDDMDAWAKVRLADFCMRRAKN